MVTSAAAGAVTVATTTSGPGQALDSGPQARSAAGSHWVSEPTVQTVAELQGRIGGMSLDDFVAAYPHPFLIESRPKADGGEAPFRGSSTAEPGAGLPTAAAPETARIVQVRKTEAGAAFRHVTIGRTANNDVQLGDSCISKLHAYLVAPADPGGRWQLPKHGHLGRHGGLGDDLRPGRSV